MYWINGTLQESLPFRLFLPDGTTRTSLHELTEEQLAELGIYPVTEIRPKIKEETQFYGEPVVTVENGKAVAVYPVVDKTKEQIRQELESARERKLTELAEARWQAETGGLTLPDGTAVKTDRESQALLTGAALKALQDPEYSCWWKAADGWVKLDAKTLLYLAEAVRSHVQSCFDREKILAERVGKAQTILEVSAVSWEDHRLKEARA